MPKKAKELNALAISRLNKQGMFAVGGVVGLYLQIDEGSKAWVLQYTSNSKRRKMGIAHILLLALLKPEKRPEMPKTS